MAGKKVEYVHIIETTILVLMDTLFIFLIFKLSAFIRRDLLPTIYAGFPAELPFRGIEEVWWLFPIWIFFFFYEGIYTRLFSFWDEIRVLWKAAFLSTISIFTIVSIGKLSNEVSQTVIVLMGLLSIIFHPIERMYLKKTLRRLGLLRRKVLILGAGMTGKLIARSLKMEPNYGYEVVGFLDDDPKKTGSKIEGIKVHKGVDRAVNYIERYRISDVFIAMPRAGKERIQGLINRLQHKIKRVFLIPDMFGVAVLGTSLHHFFHEQAFALEIRNNLESPLNIFIKRSFDLLAGVLFLIVLTIPMMIIAILIRLDSAGPAIFSQERIGKNGKRFRCYKFRTMYKDAEERLKRLLQENEEMRREWEMFWKLRDDPRLTRIGRFLRKTSLDELPQIFNVIKGEMSLVGPRPYLPREWEHIKEYSEIIHNVLPGITGLWQVTIRNREDYNHRIMLDTWYVRNWNIYLDIVIILKTVGVVLKMEGAY